MNRAPVAFIAFASAACDDATPNPNIDAGAPIAASPTVSATQPEIVVSHDASSPPVDTAVPSRVDAAVPSNVDAAIAPQVEAGAMPNLAGPLPPDYGLDEEGILDEGVGEARDLSLHIDDSDSLLATWIESQGASEIIKVRTFDAATGWSAIVALTGPIAALGTLSVVHSPRTGATLITWIVGGEAWTITRISSSAPFGPPRLAAMTPYADLTIAAAIADNGMGVLAWRNADTLSTADNQQWWTATHSPTAEDWSPEQVFFEVEEGEIPLARVMLTATATQVVAFWGRDVVRSRFIGSEVWSEEMPISAMTQNGTTVAWLRAAATPNGGVFALWEQLEKWVSLYDPDTQTWSEAVADPQPYFAQPLTLDINAAGQLQVWMGSTTSNEFRYGYHEIGSDEWPKLITFHLTPGTEIVAANATFGAQKRGAFAWSDAETTTTDNLYLQRFDPSTNALSEPLLLENQTNWADSPQVALDSGGKVFVAWRQRISGQRTRVFLRVVL
jgi:hypothetical protein